MLGYIMPSPQELGIKTAKTILAELTIPPNVKCLDSKLAVLEEVPSDCKFFKYEQNKAIIEPTKEALLQDMLNNQKSVVAFCCTSLQIDTRLAFDIDHVFPRERITEKQKILLNYLNDLNNDIFAKAFMGEKPKDDTLKEKISKYFKRDPKDNNKIKGTRWFFEVCYNNLSNLFHLKNYLNRGKSAITPQKWFEENFPLKFTKEITAKGGINEGIIMQQIFPTIVSDLNLDNINLGKDSKGNDVIVYLHEGNGIGLGSFVRQWFKDNASEIIENSKDIHEIHKTLTEMLADDLHYSGNKKEGVEKFLLAINEILNVARFRDTMSRGSTPDSEGGEEERHVIAYDKIKEAFDYMHSVRLIKKQILPYVTAGDRDIVEKNFYRYCREQKLPNLNNEEIAEAAELFIELCKQKMYNGITDRDIQNFIQQAQETVDPRKRLEKERITRKAVEAKLTEKDSRIAELEQQLEAALAGQQFNTSHSTSEDFPKPKKPRL